MLKFKITLEDAWCDDQGNIEDGIKSHIINQLKRNVWETIKEEVKAEISKAVKEQIESEMKSQIAVAVASVMNSPDFKIAGVYSSDPKQTVEEYVAKQFDRHNGGYNSVRDRLDGMAKKHATEMKNRYDLLFASQLVAKMSDQGLLKEGVFKAIMGDNGESES